MHEHVDVYKTQHTQTCMSQHGDQNNYKYFFSIHVRWKTHSYQERNSVNILNE